MKVNGKLSDYKCISLSTYLYYAYLHPCHFQSSHQTLFIELITAPIVGPANQPEKRFLAGGARISTFRSEPPCSSHQPEDWLASTSCCFGSADIGYSRLLDGTLLTYAIAAEPEKWLGAKHLGKLLHLVESERGAQLLDRMHKLEVVPHQTLHVPPGALHTIGEGVMIVELQEPEDLSVLCEWVGFDVAGQTGGHLGLGFPTTRTAVDCQARTREQAQKWVTSGKISKSICAPESCQYFRLKRCQVSGSISTERGFDIMVVLDEKLSLVISESGSLEVVKGSTEVIPHGDGELRLHGDANVLIAWPPQWR